MKHKSFHKFFGYAMSASMVLTLLPMGVQAQDTSLKPLNINPIEIAPINIEAEHIDEAMLSDTRNLVLDIAWGNVMGEPEDRSETSFDGSVSITHPDAKIILIKTKNFEPHDSITNRQDPVSWTSIIYGHWDGMRVAISAPGEAEIHIETTQGSVVMTVEELKNIEGKRVINLENGKEIVLNTHNFNSRRFGVAIFWGVAREQRQLRAPLVHNDEAFTAVNFSGSASLRGGNAFRRIKPLRFEANDALLEHTLTSVAWRSLIAGGIDGLGAKVVMRPHLSDDDVLTVRFPELEFSQDFDLRELFHQKRVVVDVPVPGSDIRYILHLRVERPQNRRLVKIEGRSDVYLIEDGTKRPILTEKVFNEHDLNFADVETISDIELDELAEGEELSYPDGTLIKGSGPRVFVIDGGQRRHIVNEAAFYRLGYPNFRNVIEIRDFVLLKIPEIDSLGSDSRLPEGALIRRQGEETVYLIKGGRRRSIRSLSVFRSHHFKFKNVIDVDNERFQEIPEGEDLTIEDGSVIHLPDSDIYYLVEGGVKHPVDPVDFEALGINEENILEITILELDALETGAEIIPIEV